MMLKSKRAGLAGMCCAVAAVSASAANAGSTHKPKTIELTQRLMILSSSGSGVTEVGTSDGKIAGATVHGAMRAIAKAGPASTFTATGTLFYPAGTVRYTLNGAISSGSSGSIRLSGTGKLTGGTGRYSRARGTFTGSGTKPANSFESFTFKGKVSYR